MKTKNIVIAGAIALLGFLYWKNKKKPVTTDNTVASTEEESSGGGGGGFMGGGFMGIGIPSTETITPQVTETPSAGVSIVTPDPLVDTPLQPANVGNTPSPTTGTSVVAPDPLADANAKALADAEAKAKALADAQAKALADANDAQAKALADAEAKAQLEQQRLANLTKAKLLSATIQDNIRKRNGYKKASSVRNIQNLIDSQVIELRNLGYTSLPNGDVKPI